MNLIDIKKTSIERKTSQPVHSNMPGCIYQVAFVYNTMSRPMVQIIVTYWSPTAISHSRRDYSLFPRVLCINKSYGY